MRVLVTGGLGSMGRHVLRELLRLDLQPVVLSRQQPAALDAEFEGLVVLITGNVTEAGVVDRVLQEHPVQVVVHLAAAVGSAADEPDGFALNAATPVAVCRAAGKNGVRRMVFASSMSVYERVSGAYGYPEFRPIDERYPVHPRNPYGVAKIAAEEAGQMLATRQSMEFVSLRFGPYYGPDRPAEGYPGIGTRISVAIRKAAAGEDVVLPTWPGYYFDPIYVVDCARAVVQAVTATSLPPNAESRFHVSGQQRLNFANVGRAIEEVVPGGRVRFQDAEADKAELGARASCMVFDNGRASRWLGYKAAFPLPAAFRHYLAALKRA